MVGESNETIKEVTTEKKGYYLTVTNAKEWDYSFFLQKKYGDKPHKIIPKVGDAIEVAVVNGSTVRGVTINGKKVFYKTDADLEADRQEWLRKHEEDKQKAFKKNKARMDKDYNALPPIFKQRIDKFRAENPRFRIDYEDYELFCCKEAVKIAKTLKTPEAVEAFSKLPYEEQKSKVKIDNGHSGNTFGMAVRLAFHYVKDPTFVALEHGALTPLVGCKAYGCPHPKSAE